MKFGKFLQENAYSEWRFYYIDYEGLKKMLKSRPEGETATEYDEAEFVDCLEHEMRKVFDFREVKAGELTRHVQHCENVVDHMKGEDDDNELCAIEDEIGRITMELTELGKFSRLNYTGFLKILKKHDKHTDYMLKPMFMLRLKSKSQYVENSDSLIYRLSKLYDRIRSGDPSRKSPTGLLKPASEGQVFVRQTSKYWVHADNVTEVKCFVLKYLPVLIFPTRKRKIDLAVSSVYMDNDAMELYKGRLEKSEGAAAIRIRWYGSEEPQEVFVERKTHREDWTGEISIKARFPLKAKHVNSFISGEYKPEDIVRKLSKDDRYSVDDLEEVKRLAGEIQATIKDKKLRPMLRTVYNRMAFQLPADARVRISLDTELCMIREDGSKRSGLNWKRDDIETGDYPFDLPNSEIARFPHAVLEVKLQTHAGQEPPKWANALISSHLVEEVPKFSKYIHGCATLFQESIIAVPFWLPQMEVDIRKPAPMDVDLEGEAEGIGIIGSSGEASSVGKEGPTTLGILASNIHDNTQHAGSTGHLSIKIEPAIEDGDDEASKLLGKQKMPNTRKIFNFLSAFRSDKKVHPEPANAQGNSSAHEDEKKKIFVPVRVEPKVFFANERTFLSWIHFSIFLGGIATALVGLGGHTARISGYLFGVVSVLFTAYALCLYQWRAEKIRERDPGPYDDRVGPIVIVIVFVLAMITNMIFAAVND